MEGALYAPTPPFVFTCYSKYLKILDFANLFVADAPMKKKIKKFSFTPLSEHFEIWVWKPAMDVNVN